MRLNLTSNILFREIEVIHEREKKEMNFMYLNVELLRFVYKDIEYSVVYFEEDGDEILQVANCI